MEYRKTERHGKLKFDKLDCGRDAVGAATVDYALVNLGMLCLQLRGIVHQLGGVALAEGLGYPYVEVNKGIEHRDGPYGSENVEEQVSQGGLLGSHVTAERCQDRGDGGSDVAAQHDGAAH